MLTDANYVGCTHTLLHVTPLQSVPDLLLAVPVKRVQIGPGNTHKLIGPELTFFQKGLELSYLTVPLNSTGS